MTRSSNSLRIVMTGLIGSIPLAGLTMHYLQYVLGLHRLGHDVLYVEDTGTWYYDLATDSMIEDESPAVAYLRETMTAHGLEEKWTFIDHKGVEHGCVGRRFRDFVASAELFINVTGAGIMRDEYVRIPRRAFIDTDPGYIQLRIAQGSAKDIEQLGFHDSHFTFGMNLGKPGCRIPTCGLSWQGTVQPLCLDLFPAPPPARIDAPFTTIMKWQTYDAIEHEQEVYGLKDIEFLKFADLPVRADQAMEIAYMGSPPVDDLTDKKWRLRRGQEVSATVGDYLAYIASSRGEWSVAKNAYVKMHSGWFSERSACYLAFGRPVVVQDTGFSDWMRTGLGVMPFTDLEKAVEAIADIAERYETHRDAAREMAAEYFDARKVLPELLGIAMN
jgi:hypothetical protein